MAPAVRMMMKATQTIATAKPVRTVGERKLQPRSIMLLRAAEGSVRGRVKASHRSGSNIPSIGQNIPEQDIQAMSKNRQFPTVDYIPIALVPYSFT